MGIHTGDSITVAPTMTLSDETFQRMRDMAIKMMRNIGDFAGGCNVQFAVSPDEKEDIIEIAPKISLSNSLLIQKSRLNKKYTQSEVAKLLNIDVNIYKKYESGKITPNYNYLVKLEKILNVKLNKKKSQ